MRANIGAILREASSARRVWVVGLEPVDLTGERAILRPLVREAQLRHQMRLVERRSYGVVHLVLLERGGTRERHH